MKNQALNKIVAAASIFGMFATASVYAQPTEAPDCTVNAQGQLECPDMDPIDPPAGTVTAGGDLDINGTIITKPVATVNADGSLTVGTETYQVPVLSNNPMITWWNQGSSETVQYDDSLDISVSQWHWSYSFKGFYHYQDTDFVWMRELDTLFYVSKDSGEGSPAGFWAYGFGFPSDGNNSWVFIALRNGFEDRLNAQADLLEGTVYVLTPPDNGGASSWYLIKEFDSDASAPGTYTINISISGNTNWIRLTTAP